MKKIITLFLGLAFLSSCTLSHTISCTNNPVGNKTGVAKTKLFGNQDISYATACKNGNISKVGTTEIKMTNYILFLQTKITVTGE
jgi:hypothetical protein